MSLYPTSIDRYQMLYLFLDEFFAPLFLAASTDPNDTQNENNNNNIPLLNPFPKKGTDIIRLLLKLGRTSAKGEIPSENFLEEIVTSLTPNGVPKIPVTNVPFR